MFFRLSSLISVSLADTAFYRHYIASLDHSELVLSPSGTLAAGLTISPERTPGNHPTFFLKLPVVATSGSESTESEDSTQLTAIANLFAHSILSRNEPSDLVRSQLLPLFKSLKERKSIQTTINNFIKTVVSALRTLELELTRQDVGDNEKESKNVQTPSHLIEILRLQSLLFNVSSSVSTSQVDSGKRDPEFDNSLQIIYDLANCMQLFNNAVTRIQVAESVSSSSLNQSVNETRNKDFKSILIFKLESVWPILSQLSFLMGLLDSLSRVSFLIDAKSNQNSLLDSNSTSSDFDWDQFVVSEDEQFRKNLLHLFLFSNPFTRLILLRTLKSFDFFKNWLFKVFNDQKLKKSFIEYESRRRKEEVGYLSISNERLTKDRNNPLNPFNQNSNLDSNGLGHLNASGMGNLNFSSTSISLAVSQQLNLAKDSLVQILNSSAVDLSRMIEKLSKNQDTGKDDLTEDGESCF